jgi:hypothetical protein
MGVAAVNYEVGFIQVGHQKAERIIDGLSGGDQQQDRPGRVQYGDKFPHLLSRSDPAFTFFPLGKFPSFCCVHIIDCNTKSVVGHIEGKISTHRACPHYPYIAFDIRQNESPLLIKKILLSRFFGAQ